MAKEYLELEYSLLTRPEQAIFIDLTDLIERMQTVKNEIGPKDKGIVAVDILINQMKKSRNGLLTAGTLNPEDIKEFKAPIWVG